MMKRMAVLGAAFSSVACAMAFGTPPNADLRARSVLQLNLSVWFATNLIGAGVLRQNTSIHCFGIRGAIRLRIPLAGEQMAAEGILPSRVNTINATVDGAWRHRRPL